MSKATIGWWRAKSRDELVWLEREHGRPGRGATDTEMARREWARLWGWETVHAIEVAFGRRPHPIDRTALGAYRSYAERAAA